MLRMDFSSRCVELRQGCPLSPYLFLLCTEGLSYLLNQRADPGLIEGIKRARMAHIIYLLIFFEH